MENSCDKKKGTGQQCWGVVLIQFKQPGKNGAASQVIAINESGSSKYFQVHVITLRVSKASTNSSRVSSNHLASLLSREFILRLFVQFF